MVGVVGGWAVDQRRWIEELVGVEDPGLRVNVDRWRIAEEDRVDLEVGSEGRVVHRVDENISVTFRGRRSRDPGYRFVTSGGNRYSQARRRRIAQQEQRVRGWIYLLNSIQNEIYF